MVESRCSLPGRINAVVGVWGVRKVQSYSEVCDPRRDRLFLLVDFKGFRLGTFLEREHPRDPNLLECVGYGLTGLLRLLHCQFGLHAEGVHASALSMIVSARLLMKTSTFLVVLSCYSLVQAGSTVALYVFKSPLEKSYLVGADGVYGYSSTSQKIVQPGNLWLGVGYWSKGGPAWVGRVSKRVHVIKTIKSG